MTESVILEGGDPAQRVGRRRQVAGRVIGRRRDVAESVGDPGEVAPAVVDAGGRRAPRVGDRQQLTAGVVGVARGVAERIRDAGQVVFLGVGESGSVAVEGDAFAGRMADAGGGDGQLVAVQILDPGDAVSSKIRPSRVLRRTSSAS
ncbi:MAG: hypothetical protein GY722_14980 [bacterium]|nr:hypothetical protein [bacterium]